MTQPSPKITFDNRLLAVEEQFKQRKYIPAIKELAGLNEQDFADRVHEAGLYHLLVAEGSYFEGNYRHCLDHGLKAARIIAGYALNRRYGRAQLVLSKTYSALGDLKNAEIRARDALAAYRRATDKVGQVDSLNELARVSYIRCNYKAAAECLDEAISLVDGNRRKTFQLTGNLGMIRVRTGHWNEAEKNLNEALQFNIENKQEVSQAVNLLSLGYLHLRRRHFILAGRHFDRALEVISRLKLKREKNIYLEYAGELAFEKGDFFKAKSLLSDAYQKGMMIAPASALVSQAGRRLAEAELALDNVDEAMKHAQKALELSTSLGERLEIGLSRRVIAQIFEARGDQTEAHSNIDAAIEILREVGEPVELARTLLVAAEMFGTADDSDKQQIRAILKEANRIFKRLDLEYWMAENDFRSGVICCQQGDLSNGFRKLSRAEKVFRRLEEKARLRAVSRFLKTLSDQAVALSISQENRYKIFGNLLSDSEMSNMDASGMEELLKIALSKSGGDRAMVFAEDSESGLFETTFEFTDSNKRKFTDGFGHLLGEEISRTRPTLILDCRRDPFVKNLFSELPQIVASIMVVPFKMSGGTRCFLYIDRLSVDGSLSPFNQEQLNFAVGFSDLVGFKMTEIQKNRLLRDNLKLKSQLMEKSAFPNIITQDHNLLKILAQVTQVLDSNISISIEGETGSGKDLLAKAIHFNSIRRDYRFISVNCAALPETLLESELFGYKRGAFTGADRDKPGLIEEADGGTFFLDEIADMPLSIQAKILRVLETLEIVRLGETEPRKVDVRILSATNKELKEQMDAGTFRQDLYYRLAAFSFKLPALRERRADIPLLVSHFMKDSIKKISPEVMTKFVNYDWPGNVRELDNEVKKLILLSGDANQIEESLLSAKFDSPGMTGTDMPAAVPCDDDIVFGEQYSLYDFLSGHEKKFIIRALREKRGVKKHAAALLSIPESTLRLKIKQYDIDLKQLDSYN